MTLRHKGIRPVHPVEVLDFKRKLFIEDYPDGGYKIWTQRMLRSGCDKIVEDIHELRDCYYCPRCDEWFHKDQWESV